MPGQDGQCPGPSTTPVALAVRAGRWGLPACAAQEMCIRDRRQFVVVPQRIDFGQIGKIEAAALQAGEVGHHIEVVQGRVHVEVRLVEAAAVAIALGAGEACSLRCGDAGVEVQPAQRWQAEGLSLIHI